MNSKIIMEDQLKERLLQAGKTNEEIEALIGQYVEVPSSGSPDMEIIAELLKKSQADNVLRVRSFNLTSEQYDTLLNFCEEAKRIVPGQQVTANLLVEEAIKEFISLLS